MVMHSFTMKIWLPSQSCYYQTSGLILLADMVQREMHECKTWAGQFVMKSLIVTMCEECFVARNGKEWKITLLLWAKKCYQKLNICLVFNVPLCICICWYIRCRSTLVIHWDTWWLHWWMITGSMSEAHSRLHSALENFAGCVCVSDVLN